jgi:2-keto-4-pentenoate hydratase/2-oxohepta-3-ene-1,7-dioic acid hydratase in catechol pathway
MTLTSKVKSVDIILAPVEPPAIYCVGLNYADHAAEVKMETPKYPVVFMKSVTSVTGHGNAIVIPVVASDPPEVDYEAELAVIIGREGKNIPASRAMDYILGYTIINDVTARRWQGKRGGGQWARAKSFDTFCPMGPFLVPTSAIPDPHNLTIRTTLNGDVVQDSNTSNMIFTIPQLIEFISQGTTLLPGTVISTGTPAGVGYVKERYLKRGDSVSITIQGLGTLRNVVAQDLPGGFTEYAGVQ